MRQPIDRRHDRGQNFLIDRHTISTVCTSVAATNGPILEIGPGGGALTLALERLGRRLDCLEVDPERAADLTRRVSPTTTVRVGDVLDHRFSARPHVVVGNLPFGLTTPILRRLLSAPGWTDAVLIVQWEVARKRAAVGGATMLTAQWWPWFDFTLVERVPAAAFRPRPAVDGGVLTIGRRRSPLLAWADRRNPHRLVQQVFTGRGRGVGEILGKTIRQPPPVITDWLRRAEVAPGALPRDLSAQQWARLSRSAAGRDQRSRRGRSRPRADAPATSHTSPSRRPK
ncbi:MAG: 23S ribosomal RNA methyltransferase Erm [Propionibacteriales bacterium]|nr:23S ribosomal RNA methyltransferase Erm [Propionibacteriales bacterium]